MVTLVNCHSPTAMTGQYLWSHAWVPASVVAAPQIQMSGGDHWVQNMVLIVYIEGVSEVLRLAVERQHGAVRIPPYSLKCVQHVVRAYLLM